MSVQPFSASGKSFCIHEWQGSGPSTLHVHYSDDEAWHVLDGELTFRFRDRTETAGPGSTVVVPAGMPHTYSANESARYLIMFTPRIAAPISVLHADRDPAHQHDLYLPGAVPKVELPFHADDFNSLLILVSRPMIF